MIAFIERSYEVHFHTPAFLGNAEQKAQWRTPPIKALLREWWRIRVARQFDYDAAKIRAEEKRIFGSAADANSSQRSRVQLRLSPWDIDDFDAKQQIDSTRILSGKFNVSVGTYLAYGPILAKQNGASRCSLRPESKASHRLDIRLQPDGLGRDPEEVIDWIEDTIALAHRFGAIGSRARNGWGSISIVPSNGSDGRPVKWDEVQRPFSDCMKDNWPHAIGKDEDGPLIWITEKEHPDWKNALKELALARQGINRYGIETPVLPGRGGVLVRHLLSYPVTKHEKTGWTNQQRLPSQLRCKVIRQSNGKYKGLLFHMPALCALDFPLNGTAQAAIWRNVHLKIQENNDFRRLSSDEIKEL